MQHYINKLKALPKSVKWIGVAVLLILVGDHLLAFVGHVLHVLLEMIELMLEHFLESHFHLGRKQAQIAVFWTGFTVGGCIIWYGLRKAYKRSCVLCKRFKQESSEWRKNQKKPVWKFVLALSGLGITFFLFA